MSQFLLLSLERKIVERESFWLPTPSTFSLSSLSISHLQNQKIQMEDYYKSKPSSYFEGNMQMERYYPPPPSSRSHDFTRSYSTATYPSSYAQPSQVRDFKLKKGKSVSGSSSSSKSWRSLSAINDPEFQRKKRVASYKVYSVEGKVKGSFRKSFRWLKDKYSQVVYGWG